MNFDDIFAANAAYVEARGASPLLPSGAARGLAVVTCVDARIDPLAVFGLELGSAAILRNLGGQVTDEVLTELVVAVHHLGVRRILVMQHTECAMAKTSLEDARGVISQASGVDASSLEIPTIADQRARLRLDLERIRSSPYIPKTIALAGAIVDLHSGRVTIE